jgi:acyl transferase domain-containing protein
MRGAVRFDSAVRAILAAGYNSFLEVSAHPILQFYLKEGFKPAIEAHQVPS